MMVCLSVYIEYMAIMSKGKVYSACMCGGQPCMCGDCQESMLLQAIMYAYMCNCVYICVHTYLQCSVP